MINIDRRRVKGNFVCDRGYQCTEPKLTHNKDYAKIFMTRLNFMNLIEELEFDYFKEKKYKHLDVYDEKTKYNFDIEFLSLENIFRDRRVHGPFLDQYNEDFKSYNDTERWFLDFYCGCDLSEEKARLNRAKVHRVIGYTLNWRNDILEELMEYHKKEYPENFGNNEGYHSFNYVYGPFLEQYNDDLVPYLKYDEWDHEMDNIITYNYYGKRFVHPDAYPCSSSSDDDDNEEDECCYYFLP